MLSHRRLAERSRASGQLVCGLGEPAGGNGGKITKVYRAIIVNSATHIQGAHTRTDLYLVDVYHVRVVHWLARAGTVADTDGNLLYPGEVHAVVAEFAQ